MELTSRENNSYICLQNHRKIIHSKWPKNELTVGQHNEMYPANISAWNLSSLIGRLCLHEKALGSVLLIKPTMKALKYIEYLYTTRIISL